MSTDDSGIWDKSDDLLFSAMTREHVWAGGVCYYCGVFQSLAKYSQCGLEEGDLS